MKRNFIGKILIAFLFSLSIFQLSRAQLSITASGVTNVIDFENTVVGVNNGLFLGRGFEPVPAAGRLDSDAWRMTGMSDGSTTFGGTFTNTGDFARGGTAGPIGSALAGGLYGLTNGTTNFLVIQPGGTDWTPGTLVLRVQNNTGSTITNLAVSYQIAIRNNEERGNSFNFSYSSDDTNYTSVAALDYTSPAAADALGVVFIPRSTIISGIAVNNGNLFHLRWNGDDVNGVTNRDEFGLDSIGVVANVNAMDVTAPSVSSLTPTDGATNIGVNANLVISFNENVQTNVGNITIVQTGVGNFEVIPMGDGRVSVAGTTVTINPAGTFSSGTDYHVLINAGAIEDLAGNDFAGFGLATDWNFTTIAADVTAPVVNTLTPADGAVGVGLNANLVISFDENVQTNVGNITIVETGVGNFEVIPMGDGRVSVAGTTVTINPTGTFASGTDYHVLVEAGAIEDLSGNGFDGFALATDWNFTTVAADVTAPAVTTLTPADGAAGVGLNANLVISFDENVQTNVGNITIVETGVGNFEVIPMGDGRVSVAGTTVTINPAGTFASGTDYHVLVEAGAIEDLAGNDFAGFGLATDWSFTTALAISSDVVWINEFHYNNAGVDTNEFVEVFVTTNYVGNLSDIQVTLYNGGNGATYASQTLNNFIVGASIGSGTFYSFTFVGGSALQNGPDGVALSVNGALVPNQFLSYQGTFNATNGPAAGATSEDVGVDQIANPPIGSSLGLIGSGTVYSDFVWTNLNGLATAGGINVGQTIAGEAPLDVTAPAITSLNPLDNAINVNVNANLVAQFSENVVAGAGNITIVQTGVGNFEVIPVNDGRVGIVGNTVTINPTGTLAANTAYNILIDSGAIQDGVTNAFAGINNATTWNFTTVAAANTAPSVEGAGIADVVVGGSAPATIINLPPAFQDAETTDANLVYSVTATNFIDGDAEIFSNIVVDNAVDTLTLSYLPNSNGVYTLTVRATDAGGLFVEDTFQVTVLVGVNPAVDPNSITNLIVTPTNGFVSIGKTLQMTATGVATNGTTNLTLVSSWSSADTNIAIVDNAGVVTGITPGDTLISAVFNSITNSVTVKARKEFAVTFSKIKPAKRTTKLKAGKGFTVKGAFDTGTNLFTATDITSRPLKIQLAFLTRATTTNGVVTSMTAFQDVTKIKGFKAIKPKSKGKFVAKLVGTDLAAGSVNVLLQATLGTEGTNQEVSALFTSPTFQVRRK